MKMAAIRFVHEETVPVNEYPEIQVIRTTGEQDVTILSLNLNGDEIFWHQEGDTLIFDQPITAKENTVKVIAVIDGRRIVHMPIWRSCIERVSRRVQSGSTASSGVNGNHQLRFCHLDVIKK